MKFWEQLKQREIQGWYKDVQMGRLKYILYKGVLLWGVPMFFIMTFLLPRLSESNRGVDTQSIIVGAVIWTIAGTVFGWALWRANVKKHGMTPKEPAE